MMKSHFDGNLDAFQLEIIGYYILVQCTYLDIMGILFVHRGLCI